MLYFDLANRVCLFDPLIVLISLVSCLSLACHIVSVIGDGAQFVLRRLNNGIECTPALTI
jgi:hypothetical protein